MPTQQHALEAADCSRADNVSRPLLDDGRWERRNPGWRERAPAMPWPQELLEAFSLRMAGHGMSISRPLMLCDKCYALRQLVDAQTLGDETLRLLSVQLFRHFEARQSGLPVIH
ncbi:MAG: hypothetical protein JNK17_04470 [Hydrogenophaga sp.]|uniref:hypothetical protein n=1 Tax=Hydrogenophaga sp. TaxID=1904254 RepID=UPI001A59F376|nr:hypothetical protein [Hydrogenophaga sp.]